MARILGVRDRGGAPCHQVRALAGKKLAEVESRIDELTTLREELRVLLGGLGQPVGFARAVTTRAVAGVIDDHRPRKTDTAAAFCAKPINRQKENRETQ